MLVTDGSINWSAVPKNLAGDVLQASVTLNMFFDNSGTGAYQYIKTGQFTGTLYHTTFPPTVSGKWDLYP
jgi:hypothetical protein